MANLNHIISRQYLKTIDNYSEYVPCITDDSKRFFKCTVNDSKQIFNQPRSSKYSSLSLYPQNIKF